MRKIVRQKGRSVKQSRLAVFGRDERGAALVEYSLLIGLISSVVILFIIWISDWLTEAWQGLVDALGIVIW